MIDAPRATVPPSRPRGSAFAAAAAALLRPALGGDGGFAERPGGRFRPDATAWAAIALAGTAGEGAILAARACDRLAAAQRPDGSVPVAAEHPAAVWPTALALLAWQTAGGWTQARERAEGFLLSVTGTRAEGGSVPELGHDVSLRGWPWTVGAHSWVEPTALALLALRRAGRASHPRVGEGLRLLLDRQLSGGGWNYGNTTVFGAELAPQPDATGAALAALAGAAQGAAVAASLALLERELPGLGTPVSLAWAIVGLGRWGRLPATASVLAGECFAREERYGGYGTTARALLSIAREGGGVLAA